MITFFNYLLEANLCLLAFYGVYIIWLRKETHIQFKRFFILASLGFSVFFPFFQFDAVLGSNLVPSVNDSIPTYWLSGVSGMESNENGSVFWSSVSVWNTLVCIYLGGVLIKGLLFFFTILRIAQLIKKFPKYQWKGCLVAKTNEQMPTFSFFHYIVVGHVEQFSDKDLKQILDHELVHVKRFHSLDIIFLNLIGILFWFNPLHRYYKKVLTQLHEFEADACAVENNDLSDYCNLLAKVVVQSADFSIANHFNQSLTFKRIRMMKTKKTKIKPWKVVCLAFSFPFLFTVVACQEQLIEELEPVLEGSSMAMDYPVEVKQALSEIQKERPNSIINVVVMDQEGENKLNELEKKYGKIPASVHVIKPKMISGQFESQSYIIVEYDKQVNSLMNQKLNANKGEVFTVVEKIPEPKDGLEAYYQYIQKNIRYPQQAKEIHLEGKVHVQFIVNEDGSISDVEVIKGLGGGCDEEAIRVVQRSGNWIPGQQKGVPVKVRMVVPINFKIS
jgi:TonB family protein